MDRLSQPCKCSGARANRRDTRVASRNPGKRRTRHVPAYWLCGNRSCASCIQHRCKVYRGSDSCVAANDWKKERNADRRGTVGRNLSSHLISLSRIEEETSDFLSDDRGTISATNYGAALSRRAAADLTRSSHEGGWPSTGKDDDHGNKRAVS